MKFRFLPHTADAKFQAYGRTLDEAFSNAALAMFSIMVDTKSIDKKITKKISVKAPDYNALLYKFLEKLLYFLDTNYFLLNNVKKLKIVEKGENYFLTSEVMGDKFREKYELLGSVKAVTYNQMFVKKVKNKFVVQVVVDL
ncbi:MAG: archease [Candidatus Nanoarchaeia archaeon]